MDPIEEERVSNPEVTYSDDVVPTKLVIYVLIGLVVFSVALCLLAWGLLVLRESQLRPERYFPERNLGAPHEIANIRQEPFEGIAPKPVELERQRADVHAYGWVDAHKRLVRIPVERAWDLMAEEQKK